MTSESAAYVWVWLPDALEPVIAGRISKDADQYLFNYGKSYIARENAIALNAWELPLQAGFIPPLSELTLAGCLRDGCPNGWGRRVTLNFLSGHPDHGNNVDQADELPLMLHSGSNRIGSLDFQQSATQYIPRAMGNTSLQELNASIERMENGLALTPSMDNALIQGASLGGLRPKACVSDKDKQYIVKFPSQSDVKPVVKYEYIAMRLAAEVGLYVAPVHLISVDQKEVLLVERFDRTLTPNGWTRKTVLSAMTLLELNESMCDCASYSELADLIRSDFKYPDNSQKELFSRLVFNILIGNTDDHVHNHSAFWDGKQLHLTPAYDICPQDRTNAEAQQTMRILGDRKASRIDLCLCAAPNFGLNNDSALHIIERQIRVIKAKWESVCDEAKLSTTDRQQFWGQQLFNPFSLEGHEQLID